jgi:hypothetical protein
MLLRLGNYTVKLVWNKTWVKRKSPFVGKASDPMNIEFNAYKITSKERVLSDAETEREKKNNSCL